MCRRSSAAMTSAEYGCDVKDQTFAPSEIHNGEINDVSFSNSCI